MGSSAAALSRRSCVKGVDFADLTRPECQLVVCSCCVGQQAEIDGEGVEAGSGIIPVEIGDYRRKHRACMSNRPLRDVGQHSSDGSAIIVFGKVEGAVSTSTQRGVQLRIGGNTTQPGLILEELDRLFDDGVPFVIATPKHA